MASVFRQRYIFAAIVAGVAFPLLALGEAEKTIPTPPFELAECYQLALQTSEQLKRSEQDIRVAEAQYRQVLSAIYPQLSIGAQQTVRDNANFGRIPVIGGITADDPASPTGGRSGSLGKSQFDATLSVEQPIFTGFREYLLSDAIEHETSALRFDLQRNRELLYQDVAEIFYQILRADADLEVLEKSEKTIQSRIKELENFRALGKSRDSEVLAAEAEQEDLRAVKERTIGQSRATKELLAFLTGIKAADLNLEPHPPMPTLHTVDFYVTRAAKRFDIKSSELRVSAQQQRLKVAERGQWPNIDLVGNAYPLEDPDRNREWELLFRLSIPVFDGWLTEARTAEELARLQSADLLLAETRRAGERDVRNAYERASAGAKERDRSKKLVEAAKKSYESQKKDYEFGVVSNLEVLQAIRQLQEAERRLVVASYTFLNEASALEVAAGGIRE